MIFTLKILSHSCRVYHFSILLLYTHFFTHSSLCMESIKSATGIHQELKGIGSTEALSLGLNAANQLESDSKIADNISRLKPGELHSTPLVVDGRSAVNILKEDISSSDSSVNNLKEGATRNTDLGSSIHKELSEFAMGPKNKQSKSWGWLQTTRKYLPDVRGRLSNGFWSYFGTSQIDIQDKKRIVLYLKLRNVQIHPRIVDRYYQLLSVSDKSPKTMIKFDPKDYALIEDLKNKQLKDFEILQESFQEILTKEEFSRREGVLNLQAQEIKKVGGWAQEISKLSRDLGTSPEEIRKAGEVLEIGTFFPSFKGKNADEIFDQVKLLYNEKPGIFKGLVNYLGVSEYSSRINLLVTMSNMKHLQNIPSEKISSWLTQGLDVNRMLKIVDHTKESFRDGKMIPITYQFTDLRQAQNAKKLFFSETKNGKIWDQSFEHDQILQLSEEISTEYLELRHALGLMDTSQFLKYNEVLKPETTSVPTSTRLSQKITGYYQRHLGSGKIKDFYQKNLRSRLSLRPTQR